MTGACWRIDSDYASAVMNPRKQLAKTIRDELTHSDSVLIPESTLQAFLEASTDDLSLEAYLLATENGWAARLTPDRHWVFEQKVS
jgi:hypothetical protein